MSIVKKNLQLLIMLAFVIKVFTCCNSNASKTAVVDNQGNTYEYVQIGEQVWMTENLKTTKDKMGNSIPLVKSDSIWALLENNNTSKAYCFYNNDESLGYGALYTYAAAKDVCPEGWHLPSDEDWTQLEKYLAKNGFEGTEYKALKSTFGWNDYTGQDGNGTDDYGFKAIAGGFRIASSGEFANAKHTGAWWTSTEEGKNEAYLRGLHSDFPGIYRVHVEKSEGLFVRCIKD